MHVGRFGFVAGVGAGGFGLAGVEAGGLGFSVPEQASDLRAEKQKLYLTHIKMKSFRIETK